PPAPPMDPIALLATPVGSSGLSGAAAIRRVGPRLGIQTVRDLLFHLPRRYDDRRRMETIAQLTGRADGEQVSSRVTVRSIRVELGFRRRIQRTIALVEDETGQAEAVWFGRRYIERRIAAGDHLVMSGRLKKRGFGVVFDDPEFQREDGDGDLLHAGRIVPIYRLTAGIAAPRLRLAMREAIDRAGLVYPEYLPADLIRAQGLVGIGSAIESAHYPADPDALDAALRRLAFDELLALQLGMVGRRRQRVRSRAQPLVVEDRRDAEVRSALSAALSRKIGQAVELTADQLAANGAIRADLARAEPMLRLLQGDVGSGKTAVAAYALALVAGAGRQSALLAPTDLLARQHAATLADLLDDLGIPVTLLTGSLSAAGTRNALEAIADGRAAIVVGTHALLQERVSFADLGLVIIDEQHRFGVEQRGQLEAKAGGTAPHVLLMTATPIPRTLGQVVYADLDVTDLRTPPAGRVPIRTGIRHPADIDRLWEFVRAQAAEGRRTFVVVPAIEDSDDEGAVAAKSEAERLTTLLAPLRVGLVHGRMKAADRDAEMSRFRDGGLDVLVGTTVVEVGVDVPEATVMAVQGADRFGLAQLHQLRGRVGRGTAASYAALVSDAAPSTAAWDELVAGRRAPETTEQARLVAVARTLDGFELAEADFELRREGDVLGLAQSGLPRLRVASLQRTDHRVLAADARRHAEALLDDAGELSRPGQEPLRRELAAGWLEGIAAGEPETAA
ncbi:MAG: ATP-dependent helicase RecG, partial [Chloroflexota bacterium]|nr:ATP-dependent helicase RecG [Chloroflexota bacterium]